MAKQCGQMRKKVLLLGISVAFAVLLAEIVLRFAGFSSPNFRQTDLIVGRSLRPGVKGWYTAEGRAFVAINRDGLRDCEHSLDKPKNCLRIAVLGDSYAEAMNVELADSFPKVLERTLNASVIRTGMQFEVINFGVSGYGTGLEYLTLQQKVWKYSPDVILLAFFAGNDVSDNSSDLSRNLKSPFPFFDCDETGMLIVDNSFRQDPSWKNHRWLEQLGLIDMINSSSILQITNAVIRNGSRRDLDTTVTDCPWNEPGLSVEVYREPTNDQWRKAWKVTETLIRMLNSEVEQHGAKLHVVTLSRGVQVHPDPQYRQSFMNALDISDLFYPDRRIAELCGQEGIPVLMLAPYLQAIAEETGIYLHGAANTRPGTGHWNENGHKLAGQRIAAELRSYLPVMPASASLNDEAAAINR